MRKITASKIIGFEITYNDMKGFQLSTVLEGMDLPERSCTTIYVPYEGYAKEINWEYDCGGWDLIGIEFDPCGKCGECKEHNEAA